MTWIALDMMLGVALGVCIFLLLNALISLHYRVKAIEEKLK